MKITTQDYNIADITKCTCGHEFNIHDIDGLASIDNHGFYSNVVKYCSHIHCPQCNKETILLLKQKGQTWDILGIATSKTLLFKEIEKQEQKLDTTIENKTVSNLSNELVCPICQKVCKSKVGLNAHMRTHNK